MWSSATSYGEIRAIDQSVRLVHLGAAAEGRPLLWDDPAWQKGIRQTGQQVAEHEWSRGAP